MAVEDRPSLLILRSHIGYPSPEVHRHRARPTATRSATTRSRRTKDDPRAPPDETFYVPDDVLELLPGASACARRRRREAWEERLADWTGDRAELRRVPRRPAASTGWDAKLPTFERRREDRHPPGRAARASTPPLDVVPGLIGGGADLTGNTGTELEGRASIQSAEHPGGRQIHFGIREHGMGAVMNGMALHGGVAPGRRHVLRASATTCARRSGSPRSARPRSSSSGPTTRSASARTARPTSRSSSSPRCGRCPGLQRDPPGRRQRDRAGVAHRGRARRARPRSS